MSYHDSGHYARETGEVFRLLRGMLRRVVVTLHNAARWQVTGRQGNNPETFEAEAFAGIGFAARPPANGNPEAIAAAIGGTASTVIIATRDEATRQASVGSLGVGETAVYNDKAVIVIKANGTVEIRLVGGVAVPLATKADLDSLRAIFANWTPVASDGGAALKTAIIAASPLGWHPTGTTVLKGQ